MVVPAGSLDVMHSEIIPFRFSHEDLSSFLQIDSHQFSDNCSSPKNVSMNFRNFVTNSRQPSFKNGNGLSSLVALPISLTTSISERELVSVSIGSFAGKRRRFDVAMG